MIRDLKELGTNIRTRRSDLEMSQGEMAFQLGTDKGYISRIERGEINVGIIFLTEICMVLKTTPNDLLNIDDNDQVVKAISRGGE
ncbi:helix-turn-helix domain-containing protein [Pseudoalteromonas gelatinilytica]